MKKFPVLLALCCAIAFSGCQTHREVIITRATSGNPYFQGLLAEGYLYGMNFKINYGLAAKWAAESAAHQDPVGQYVLGIINEYGLGPHPVAREEAARLYAAARPGLKKMAAQGTPHALHDLGTMYLYGRGVARDYPKALALLSQAAKSNYPPAMADLAGMYMNGYGVPADAEYARKLLLRAAQEGLPEAQVGMGGIYFGQGKYISARNWYRDAAEKNSPAAITALGTMCLNGIDGPKNLRLAEGYFNQAAQVSYPPAMTELGHLCLNPQNASCNPAAGEKWFCRALTKNYAPAAVALADYYAGRTADDPSAARNAMVLYQLAANNDLPVPGAADLDDRTGLYYFILLAWEREKFVSQWQRYHVNMARLVAGYRSGIIGSDGVAFRRAVAAAPLDFYHGNSWYIIKTAGMPPEWTAEIFAAVPAATRQQPLFWLCYGTCANLCGRPELAMTAVRHLLQAAMTEPDNLRAAELKDLAVIMRTSALIQRGMDREAADQLASSGRFVSDPRHLRNYLLHYAAPALRVQGNGLTELLSAPPFVTITQEKPLPPARPFFDCKLGKITGAGKIVPEPQLKTPNDIK
ncbi:MAG: tetratricopeptide repeat protein [Victivallales bacterium]|nr:tetratricopeptide repeat protein [Victivallales bacterium]